MKTSLKVIYKKQRITKKGEARIYIRVIINRIKKEIMLDMRWPIKYFDQKAGVCKPRFDNDQECEDNNIIIRRELSKCNEIFRYYRLADIPITITRFYRDYNDNLSKSSFINYMQAKIKSRYANREIVGETKIKHEAVYRKLKEYNPDLLFADFDEKWCQDYDNWLKKNITPHKAQLSQNTRWSHHKVVKTYMNQAKKDQIRFEYPYQYFTLGEVCGSWQAIFESDVKRLYDFYCDRLPNKCQGNHRQVLRAFLFACMTGLRISDLRRITRDNIMDDILVFVPQKTRKTNYLHKIPLNKMAKTLLNDAMEADLREQIFWSFE